MDGWRKGLQGMVVAREEDPELVGSWGQGDRGQGVAECDLTAACRRSVNVTTLQSEAPGSRLTIARELSG